MLKYTNVSSRIKIFNNILVKCIKSRLFLVRKCESYAILVKLCCSMKLRPKYSIVQYNLLEVEICHTYNITTRNEPFLIL